MTPAEVIREGRNLLFERGWHQGAFEADDKSLCAIGAVLTAAQRLNVCGLVAAQFLDKAVPDEALIGRDDQARVMLRPTAYFNDAPGRSFNEVVDLFDKAEKLAEAE